MVKTESSEILVNTICLLAASLARDADELENWGLPFIELVRNSQRVSAPHNDSAEYQFCTGKGLSLVLHSGDEDNDEYVLVDHVANMVAANLDSIDEEDLEKALPVYLDGFLKCAISSEMYDSRVRSVCRHFCTLFHFHSREFLRLESRAYEEAHQSLCEQGFGDHLLDNPHKRGLVASYRVWRVGAAAAAGGALLAVTAKAAAPQLLTSLLTLLGASTTVGQFVIGISSLISFQQTLATGAMGASGAAYAGLKMLKRTEPIDELVLEHLHWDHEFSEENSEEGNRPNSRSLSESLEDGAVIIDNPSNRQSTRSASRDSNGELVKESDKHNVTRTNSSRFACDDNDSRRIDTNPLKSAKPPQESAPGSPESGDTDDLTYASGGPLFILVPGQVDPERDERAVWGADGLPRLHVTDTIRSEVSTFRVQKAVDVENELPEAVPCSDRHKDGSSSSSSRHDVDIEHADGVLVAHTEYEEGDDAWHHLAVTEKGWWKDLFPSGQPMLLFWARSALQTLAASCRQFTSCKVRSLVIDELLKRTPMHLLLSAASWPMTVLDKAATIDDPWVVCIDRARQAGKLLAEALLGQKQRHMERVRRFRRRQAQQQRGEETIKGWAAMSEEDHECMPSFRPVTLMGYGMGARVIFECLEYLAKVSEASTSASSAASRAQGAKKDAADTLGSADRPEHLDARGIVENVVLMGAPVGFSVGLASGVDVFLHGHGKQWVQARSMVSGRMINCYSGRDWMLAFLYRQKSLDLGVAGLQPVEICQEQTVTATGNSNDMRKCSGDVHTHSERSTFAESAAIHHAHNYDDLVSQSSHHYTDKSKRQPRPSAAEARSSCKANVPIGFEAGIENVDVTPLVSSLMEYPNALPLILPLLRLEV